jgi:hypothetical protein
MTSSPQEPKPFHAIAGSSSPLAPFFVGELEHRATERIEEIVQNLRLLLTEQQELALRLDELHAQDDEDSSRERHSIHAHMAGHKVELRRLLTELDTLTGRAN